MKVNSRNKDNKKHIKTYPSDKFVTTQALKGVKEVVPLIHRTLLSSKLRYSDYEEIFPGAIKQPDNSSLLAQKHTGGFYKNAAWLWMPRTKKRIDIYYNPKELFYPQSRLSIVQPKIDLLLEIVSSIPERYGDQAIKFSSIEYTIDFYCESPTAVSNLYYILRRNYYCQHAKSTRLLGGKYTGYSHEQEYSFDRQTNSVFVVNFSNENSSGRESKRIKFYERGNDSDRVPGKEFWKYPQCNRVRFEVTAKKRLLRNYDISSIRGFLEDPKMLDIIFPADEEKSLLQFRNFVRKNYQKVVPPDIEEDYYNFDNKGNLKFECFIDTVLHMKELGLDLSNCLERYHPLDSLVRKAKNEVSKFEKKWRNDFASMLRYH